MTRKIICNLAISLDGYIADEDGGYDWITGDGSHELDTDNQFDFEQFLSDIDLIIMGRKAFEDTDPKPFADKEIWVATNRPLEAPDNVHRIHGNIVEDVLQVSNQPGKNIYLFGGGVLIDPFIQENAIDEYIIGIIPTLLGSGRRLFHEGQPTLPLHLKEMSVTEGIVILQYTRKEE